MQLSVMECPDFSDFQEALKNMRKTDDLIVNTINTTIPTDSFHTDQAYACSHLYDTLQSGYNERNKFIQTCISVSTEKVRQLKEEKESNLGNTQLLKAIKQEQTKLRMLQVELTVEDLIKQRTMKIFNEKCRKHLKS